jgi:hypothetical protein
MTIHTTLRVSCLLAGTLFFSATAFADDGKVELAGFGGLNHVTSGVGNHGIGGASIGVRVVNHLRLFGEFTYSQIGSINASTQDVSASLKDKVYGFGAGAEYGFAASRRVVPYVVGAVGDAHETYGLTASAGGQSASENLATFNHAYFGGGGGVRFYAGDHWGFKPEVRYQRYTGTGGWTSIVATVGFFFQFGN